MKLDFNKKYTTIAVYAFLVIAASITFFYLINEHTAVSRVLGMVFNLMMPFIYGAALAYILNPILNWLERKVFPKIFRDKLSRRGQRRLGVLISFLFAAAVVAVFLAILIPQLIESVDSLARSIYAFLPQAQQMLIDFIEEYGSNDVFTTIISIFGIDTTDPALALQKLAARSYTFLTQVLPNLFGGVMKFTSGLINVIVGIIIAVLVVALAAGFGVWWFMLRDSGTQSAQTQSTSQQSGKTKSGDSKAAKDDKPCTAAPDAELSSVDHSDTNLVAQLQLTSNCASTKDGDTAEFKESDVKVSIKDDEGNVIASAVFDFSKQPVKFNGETANVALEFTTRQYWRPYDQIETGSAEVILQTGQSGTGEAGSADGDALAGSDIDSEDAERYAQLALSWQLKHDESAASRFYTTYTTQLSSKKNDMKADGKTWHYVDIYEQFLQQRIKHKNAILIWSGDYPTYTKADASTAYYVILSGDTVDSVKAGDAWCKSNGYGAADCAVVDLQ